MNAIVFIAGDARVTGAIHTFWEPFIGNPETGLAAVVASVHRFGATLMGHGAYACACGVFDPHHLF